MNYLISEKATKDESGFTIIEVLIAMVIFSIGVLGIAQMQIQALNGNKRAYEQTEAAMWASNQAETFIQMQYDNAQLADGATGTATAGTNNKYTLNWTIADLSSTTKAIQIIVTWNGKTGTENFIFDYIKSDAI